MESDDPDTKEFRLAAGTKRRGRHASSGAEVIPRELSLPPESLKSRWQVERSYEFATSEAALLFVACVVAVSMVRDVWPEVELCRERVGIRLAGEPGPSAEQRAAWRELTGWAQRLGGRDGGRPL